MIYKVLQNTFIIMPLGIRWILNIWLMTGFDVPVTINGIYSREYIVIKIYKYILIK